MNIYYSCIVAVVVLAAHAQAYAAYDTDEVIRDLYDRLARLDDDNEVYADEGYQPEDAEADDSQLIDARADSKWEDIPVDSRDVGQTSLRDEEHLQHQSTNTGFQYISGGAGEGQQHLTPEGKQNNTHEVKSDEALPFYCHPPNPCPKGFTEDKGCSKAIKDTAEEQKEWIEKMQARGECACDEEHMFNCPTNGATVNAKGQQKNRDAIDAMLDSLLGQKTENPYFSNGQKREALVAKKSPIIKRAAEMMPQLPYQFRDETQLKRVAKKGHPSPMM